MCLLLRISGREGEGEGEEGRVVEEGEEKVFISSPKIKKKIKKKIIKKIKKKYKYLSSKPTTETANSHYSPAPPSPSPSPTVPLGGIAREGEREKKEEKEVGR